MRLFTKYHKRLRITFIKISMLALFVSMLFLPNIIKLESTGDNTYIVFLNGVDCGTVADKETAEKCLREARRRIACQSDNLVFIDANMELVGDKRYFGVLDSEKDITLNLTRVLERNIKETLQRAYTVKVNETIVNLSSTTEVEALLNSALDKYDAKDEYSVRLEIDPERELNVLVADVNTTRVQEDAASLDESMIREAGIELAISDIISSYEKQPDKKSFEDYNYGIVNMGFAEDVEIVEAYLPQHEITDLETAINFLTKEQEVQQIYEVQKGDTLSDISVTVNIPMDEIIAMNDSLKDEKTILQIGQKLIITVPEPELSVVWQEECYYEESYEADIIYVDNNKWYTTEKVTLQEPVVGYRKVVAIKTHVNEEVSDTHIIKEEIVVEAVPKIVERGTIVPPTYIKPISGGRLTSYFGKRSISLKGASTYHKGVDWGVATGTPVVASSGGKVVVAGWVSGYGYAVYINHSDGKQTRYGHLSKVLVSTGTYVQQGQRIALSGNTGRSTAPHLHFEIRVNGVAKDPFNYIK